ncbi:MAG: RNB domain-containing ribonuclease [Candidatus Syntrophosphaera sp.]|nr:RNB domain-containing ribonuclease [Candidatus Syntrophosphaera sp.]
MNAFEPGKIVLFYQQERLCAGLITAVTEQRCQVLDAVGASFNLPLGRFVFISQDVYTPVSSATLLSFEQEMAITLGSLPEAEILSVLSKIPTPFSFAEACAALVYEDDLRRFSLFHYLKERPDLFVSHKGQFRTRGEDELRLYREQQRREEERMRYLQEVERFLKDGAGEDLPAQYRGQFLAELRELLVSQERKDLARLLRATAGDKALEEQVQALRLRLGDILPETDPMAAGSGIPILFPAELWRQAQASQSGPVSDAEAFSIDAEDAPDHDDAISIQALPEGWLLGVHISDVAACIPRDSDLYREAQSRVASLYLPGESVPLLPPELSHAAFSLVQSEPRPVLSLYARLDKDLKLLDHEFRRETLSLKHNFSYDEVDRRLESRPFDLLNKICLRLNEERTGGENGRKPRYFWNLKVSGHDIRMQRIDNLSPSRFIIEELMILYNRLFAERPMDSGLPLIYRNIAQFPATDEDEEAPAFGSQAYLSTQAQFHPGIGSQAYLHATSPIRRFTDIVNQAQFESLLEGKNQPYTSTELDELIPRIEKRLLYLRAVAHRSERYWLLRYLEQKHLGTPLDGILLRRLKHGYLAELSRWEKRLVLRCEDKPPLQAPVKLVVSKVDLDELVAYADVIL